MPHLKIFFFKVCDEELTDKGGVLEVGVDGELLVALPNKYNMPGGSLGLLDTRFVFLPFRTTIFDCGGVDVLVAVIDN